VGPRAFSFAIAIQNLLWGARSRSPARRRPLRAGAGACAGALLYALGLAWMAHADTPASSISRPAC
jgi:hypothetical protein